jgi:hypothetical protein
MAHRLCAAWRVGVAIAALGTWSLAALAGADVNVSINANVSAASPISPYVYGINSLSSSVSSQMGNHVGLDRMGGNRWTAYNWENNASNAGSDWGPYSNDGYLSQSNVPGQAVRDGITRDQGLGTGTIVTVPIVDYVAADKSGLVSQSQFAITPGLTTYARFNVNLARSDTPSGPVNTSDKYVYQDQFVHWVESTFPETTRPFPIFYCLDNEPGLWPYTHPEVHQAAPKYAEMLSRTIDFASMIKDQAPDALVFGPVTYGWNEMIDLQGASDANNRDYFNFYLDSMKAAETTEGHRLLDVLDIHWYPEAQDQAGSRVIDLNGPSLTASQIQAVVQAPRTYWDPSYIEKSWIGQYYAGYQGIPGIQLIPRLRTQIASHYPGTKIAITEHYPGGGRHIAGGIAQADSLGIWGREGVFAATFWDYTGNSPFILGGYQCYLNYDSAGSMVGDLALPTVDSDTTQTSAYAMRSSTDPSKLWIVAINKTAAAITAHVTIANGASYNSYKVYRLTSSAQTPQYASTNPMSGSVINYSMPAYSVSTLELSAPASPTYSLSITDGSVTEGNAGTKNETFTVTLTPTP